ncbi:MAG: CDC27 family protein [Deltaproteobacteria bacterium]|nr:CDC27 family protein [Deltaproteobacteria bacterium]
MTHLRHVLWSLIVALVLALTVAPAAEAQSVAKTQFVQAKKRYEKGEYEDALTLFRYAWEHSKSPNARLYIGRCLHKLGNVKEAYDEFRGALDDAAEKAATDEKYVKTRDAAAAELALMETQIGRVMVVLDDAVPEATVTLNGAPFPKDRLGAPVTVLPGQQRLVASAEGKDDVVREVNVGGGKLEAVALFFEHQAACPTGPTQEPTGKTADQGMSTLQLIGAITLGVGVAGLGVGAATGAAASAKFGSLEQTCGDIRCTDPAYADVVDSGKTFELVSYISLGAGGGLALIGGALLLLGGDEAPTEGAGLVPLPGGGLLTYRAAF